ncbi:transposase [Rhizobium sp. VS19-DR104.2]|uniref:Tn3 family transposase n=1 Tax=unclassified Rhizobium TaxID=2613769 RepID=UPI001C5ADEB3|nr:MULTISPECIES: Tn3 family transposase [unclassified Rhizobium]MBZ5763170.1 transposase [Rhizobium sp. VS19-DR96]MBZ5769100.1 transposase [Rhizobium sp. VS19-DR129.2]MBZ5776547.1 transposase [Rhizobium sp. VS19-DRK62.2]MBZ5787789.1 transposase [Rhizobium sp. VS19-DR121]MBZ5805004.1 transposase [Rhizobium sp. VS19-DR181]
MGWLPAWTLRTCLIHWAGLHWNAAYLGRASAHLRQLGRNIDNELLKQVSPRSWEHINLFGVNSWDIEQRLGEGFKPLRLPQGCSGPHDVHRMFDRSAGI